MKIFVSLSAVTYSKGDRVAYRVAKDDWYVGTVTSVRAGKVGILFDDGVKGAPSKPTSRSWKKITTSKKIKKALSDLAVAKLTLVESPASTKIKPVKPTTIKTAPVKPIVIAPAVTKAPVKLAKHAEHAVERVTAEEKHLLTVVGMPSEYAAVQGLKQRSPAMLKYLDLIYTKANSLFFHNRMARPTIYLLKDMGTSFKSRGYWFPGRRKLGISPRLFLSNEEQVLTTLVHEMCHQAVSEIDYVTNDGKGGHGPHWNDWMRKCGLTPSRYSQYDNETYMTDTERAEYQKKLANRKEAVEHAANVGMRKMRPRELTPAQYHDPATNTWIKGLLIEKHDQAGKRWAFTVEPHSRSWKIIPADWFYELPQEEHFRYTTSAFMISAQTIIDYTSKKAQQRQERRSFRKMARGQYWD